VVGGLIERIRLWKNEFAEKTKALYPQHIEGGNLWNNFDIFLQNWYYLWGWVV